MYSKRGTESALDLNYEFHQRQSAVSFRVLASPDGPQSFPPPLRLVSPTSFSSSCLPRAGWPLPRPSPSPPLTTRVAPPPPRAIPFSAGTGDEKFWRRHKNAALHFPFKITPFAPFSVYYYQVVQPAFSALVHPSATPRRTPQDTNGALGAYNTRKPPPRRSPPPPPLALRLVHSPTAPARLVELHA